LITLKYLAYTLTLIWLSVWKNPLKWWILCKKLDQKTLVEAALCLWKISFRKNLGIWEVNYPKIIIWWKLENPLRKWEDPKVLLKKASKFHSMYFCSKNCSASKWC
jgi:hypothetical protein